MLKIDKSYLINLPARETRLEWTERELERVEWEYPYEIVPGVEPKDGDPPFVAPTKAHLICLEKAMAANSYITLIMEDDLVFQPEWKHADHYFELLDMRQDLWDVFHFYNHFVKPKEEHLDLELTKPLGFGAHFYLVKGIGHQKLHDVWSRFEKPVDNYTDEFRAIGLKTASSGCQMVKQLVSRFGSDVDKGLRRAIINGKAFPPMHRIFQ